MTPRYLRTSDLSKAVGVHPNTVRLYEEWGFLPPIPRSPGGYRLFTPAHLDQMRLARLALADAWPGRLIRRSALKLVRQAATGDLAWPWTRPGNIWPWSIPLNSPTSPTPSEISPWP